MIEDDLLHTLRESHREREEDIVAHGKRQERRITIFLVVMFFGVLLYEWIDSRLPSPPGAALVNITDIQPTEPPALCPGDKLEFVYNVASVSEGVVDINLTLYRKTPPARTLIYSEPLTDIYIDAERQEIYAVWMIPHEVTDPFSGEAIALTPGEYQRRISISTSSRNTRPVMVPIDFVIKSECP